MAIIALVHGRDEGARVAMVSVIQALGHNVRDFAVAKRENPDRSFNSSIVKSLFSGVDAAVVALSPDEEGSLRVGLRGSDVADWQLHERLRPNVLIEFGLAVATLDSKVIEVSFGYSHSEIPSDLLGHNPVYWKSGKETGVELKLRLESLGVFSNAESLELLDDIDYEPPEPNFDNAMPPFYFIKHPMKLRHIELNPPWPDQLQAYRDAGFQIGHYYVDQRASWSAKGHVPLIFKDVDLREYVLGVFDPGFGQRKMWVGKKK